MSHFSGLAVAGYSDKSFPSIRDCDQLVKIFNDTFLAGENTVLVKGGDEPIYLPASEGRERAQIIFALDYFASALHEIAHWCVAGVARRQQVDYGYWYAPDGRTQSQQSKFERVEVLPQALEWMFCRAAGVKFRVSADNLAMGLGASEAFKDSIYQRVQHNCRSGLNVRAAAFVAALCEFYGSPNCYDSNQYVRESLD